MNILQEIQFNRHINGNVKAGVPDIVFNTNQEYEILISQTLVGEKVRMFSWHLCFLFFTL